MLHNNILHLLYLDCILYLQHNKTVVHIKNVTTSALECALIVSVYNEFGIFNCEIAWLDGWLHHVSGVGVRGLKRLSRNLYKPSNGFKESCVREVVWAVICPVWGRMGGLLMLSMSKRGCP